MHEWVDALLWVCMCQYMGENLRLSVCQDDRQLWVWAVSENQFDKLPPPGKAPTQPSSGPLSLLRPGHTHFLFLSLSCCVRHHHLLPHHHQHLRHDWPCCTPLHTHINKSTRPHVTLALHFCLPGRSGGSQLLIFMSLALQVNCLRDSAVMNIRFETRGEEVGEKNWMQRREKKKRWGGENADLVHWLPLPSLPSSYPSLPFVLLSLLLHLSFPNFCYLYIFSSYSLDFPFLFFMVSDDLECTMLILLNRNQYKWFQPLIKPLMCLPAESCFICTKGLSSHSAQDSAMMSQLTSVRRERARVCSETETFPLTHEEPWITPPPPPPY